VAGGSFAGVCIEVREVDGVEGVELEAPAW
jgi:hypothetical protein